MEPQMQDLPAPLGHQSRHGPLCGVRSRSSCVHAAELTTHATVLHAVALHGPELMLFSRAVSETLSLESAIAQRHRNDPGSGSVPAGGGGARSHACTTSRI